MRVFLSWSKRRSKAVAEAWHTFLPDVLQVVKTFLSSADLEAGVRWTADLADALGDMDHGIIVVTPENREEPWIHFEAGALSKKPGKAKVVPFLYDVDGSQVHPSLAQFNYRPFTREGVFQIVTSINNDLGELALDPGRLQRAFEKHFPDFEKRLKDIPPLSDDEKQGVKPERKVEDMVAEMLGLLRQRPTPNRAATIKERQSQVLAAAELIKILELTFEADKVKSEDRPQAFVQLKDMLAAFTSEWYGVLKPTQIERVNSAYAICRDLAANRIVEEDIRIARQTVTKLLRESIEELHQSAG
jgi:TIR domain